MKNTFNEPLIIVIEISSNDILSTSEQYDPCGILKLSAEDWYGDEV